MSSSYSLPRYFSSRIGKACGLALLPGTGDLLCIKGIGRRFLFAVLRKAPGAARR